MSLCIKCHDKEATEIMYFKHKWQRILSLGMIKGVKFCKECSISPEVNRLYQFQERSGI